MDKFGKKCKAHMMDEVMADIKARPNIFITSYMGLSSQELESLRNELARQGAAGYLVVKNSLTKKVFEKLNLSEAASFIEGGIGLGLAQGDIVSAAKTLARFSKEHNKLKILAAVLDGKFFMQDRVAALANLPPREALIATIIGGIKAPITGFVFTLNGMLKKIIYCVDAIRRRKEST